MKNNIKCVFLLIANFIAFSSCHADSDPSKWRTYVKGASGSSLVYYYESLKREDFPPIAVSAKVYHLVQDKKPFYNDWELRCNTKEIKIGSSNLISIAADNLSMRRVLLEGLCGIRNDEGLWFISEMTSNGFYNAINSSTLRRNSPDNFSFVTSYASLEINNSVKLSLFGPKHEYEISCSDLSKANYRNPGSTDQMQSIEIKSNSIGRSVFQMVCSGYIVPANPSQALDETSRITPSNTKPNQNFDSAKRTCLELGFQEKTEKYADCVLKVSR